MYLGFERENYYEFGADGALDFVIEPAGEEGFLLVAATEGSDRLVRGGGANVEGPDRAPDAAGLGLAGDPSEAFD